MQCVCPSLWFELGGQGFMKCVHTTWDFYYRVYTVYSHYIMFCDERIGFYAVCLHYRVVCDGQTGFYAVCFMQCFKLPCGKSRRVGFDAVCS